VNRGYIKIWRRLEDSAVFADANLLQLFMWCLMRATHKTYSVAVRTGRGQTVVTLQPGQFLFGRNTAAKALKCKPSTIRNRMHSLCLREMTDIQPDTHFSIVTIRNWSSYQDDAKEVGQPTGQARGQAKDTNKNVKNKRLTGGPAKDAGGVEVFFDLWNSEAKFLPKAMELTEARKRKIRARLRERSLDEWAEVFRRMNASPFLRGESGGTFRADLDWITKNKDNSLKVFEGKYDGREKRPTPKGAGPSSVNEKILGYDTVGRPLYAEPVEAAR
jgi:hypothetical protein